MLPSVINVVYSPLTMSPSLQHVQDSSSFVGFKRKSLKQHTRDLERSKIWKQNKQVSQKDSISQTDIVVDSEQNVNSHLEHVESDTLFTVHEHPVQSCTSTRVSVEVESHRGKGC